MIPRSPAALPDADKTGRFLIMGVLSLLVNPSLSAQRVRFLGRRVLKGSLIVMVAVTLEGGSQLFIASRSASLGDLLADYAGIVVFGVVATVTVDRRRSPAIPG